jgi:type IV fimbrial biogenesis protein FimT
MRRPARPCPRRPLQGLTLIELVFAIAILAILAAVAIPSYGSYIARQRVKAASESLAQDLRFAREESVRLGRSAHLSLRSGPQWCWGLSFSQPCDCGSSSPLAACGISRAGVADHPGVSLASGQPTVFEPVQGRAQIGSTEFASDAGHRLRVDLLASGRARVCVLSGSFGGIERC